MTLDEFAALVTKMRDAQRAYFRHRRPEDMQLAKDLERQVDAAIAAHNDKQRPLFGEEKPNGKAEGHASSQKPQGRRQDQGSGNGQSW